MRLTPDELVFGVAPAILLDCARQLHVRGREDFSFEDFCRALGAPVNEAQGVFDQMVSAGFFQPTNGASARFEGTPRFNQLALANISEGLSRSAAESLLRQVILKAESINQDESHWGARVVCIAVFGSYLGKKAVLGDLDLGVSVRRVRSVDALRLADEIAGWRRGLRTAEQRVLSALRLRKPKLISIHTMDEVIGLGTPYEVVFGQVSESARGTR